MGLKITFSIALLLLIVAIFSLSRIGKRTATTPATGSDDVKIFAWGTVAIISIFLIIISGGVQVWKS